MGSVLGARLALLNMSDFHHSKIGSWPSRSFGKSGNSEISKNSVNSENSLLARSMSVSELQKALFFVCYVYCVSSPRRNPDDLADKNRPPQAPGKKIGLAGYPTMHFLAENALNIWSPTTLPTLG